MKKKVSIYYSDGSSETFKNVNRIGLCDKVVVIYLLDKTEITIPVYSFKKLIEKNE